MLIFRASVFTNHLGKSSSSTPSPVKLINSQAFYERISESAFTSHLVNQQAEHVIISFVEIGKEVSTDLHNDSGEGTIAIITASNCAEKERVD
jgi:hypothetical protein